MSIQKRAPTCKNRSAKAWTSTWTTASSNTASGIPNGPGTPANWRGKPSRKDMKSWWRWAATAPSTNRRGADGHGRGAGHRSRRLRQRPGHAPRLWPQRGPGGEKTQLGSRPDHRLRHAERSALHQPGRTGFRRPGLQRMKSSHWRGFIPYFLKSVEAGLKYVPRTCTIEMDDCTITEKCFRYFGGQRPDVRIQFQNRARRIDGRRLF